ncbi:response regulator [Alicyclobacillus mengziensis]|uniref:Response regulator transcription factor n=1 Tax=Alicyclobacillus mengziensis TaxID=2931921 RepID=A0A9X7Z6F9_9BACL|nr:response regulator transcription factor [Alicyclobacillus mengziensis]QSO46205.1 response regulator transcription factor [Alicyclobacillus mengziensis]
MTEHPAVSNQNRTEPETHKVKVGIVDDHQMVREGLRAFLGYAKDIEVAFLACDGREALEQTVRTEPDVVLMDLVMPGEMDGIEATRQIRTQAASVHIIALTSFQETERVLAALDAGAIGYLQKDVSPTDLLAAIRQAAVGRAVLDPAAFAALQRMARNNPTSETLVEPLTSREQEVLDALATGFSNKEIASKLGISDKTVKVHVSHILSKLGVYDRTQALLAAAKLGLIQLDLKHEKPPSNSTDGGRCV